jgi:hypothetical protein
MKKLIVITIAALALNFTACKENDKSSLQEKADKAVEANKELAKEANKSAEKTAESVAAELKEARDRTRKEIQEGIENINTKIKETDKDIAKATKAKRAEWEIQKAKLIKSRDRLSMKMDELGKDMKDGWETFEADVKKALAEIKDDMKQ